MGGLLSQVYKKKIIIIKRNSWITWSFGISKTLKLVEQDDAELLFNNSSLSAADVAQDSDKAIYFIYFSVKR